MIRLFLSRRTMTAFYSITCLTLLGILNKTDSSMAIAAVASAMCASNAFQKSKEQGETK